jgi:amino acid adenylation domain-containing protein
MNSTITHLIQQRSHHQPEAIAIMAPGRSPVSYGQLATQIQAIHRQLQNLGIQSGDRIALVLPNGPEMAVAFLAIASAVTSAPLNPNYQESEFDFYLSDLQVKAVITLAGMDSPVRRSAIKQGVVLWELLPDRAKAGLFQLQGNPVAPASLLDAAEPQDIALILHTSGTTARPKMVPLPQSHLCRSAQQIQTTLAITPADRSLNIMPLFHIHGLVGVLLASLTGGGAVICTPGFGADAFFDWWETERPTWYSAVPTLHQAILSAAAAHRDVIERSPLRLIRSSSASLPAPVLRDLEATFNVPVIEAYGMTEAAHQMASNPLPPAVRRLRSVGQATGLEIAIMDKAGNRLTAGEIGEVVIRGETVTPGYLDHPEANAKAFTQGWFRTGDRGYLDPEGYLFLQGRLKEMINRGGEKISPLEVDEVLLTFPGVAQAVTFAVPHPTLGEDVAAAVVPHPNLTVDPTTLRQWLFQQVADYKVPSQIVIVASIPKGATGKMQRIGLAEKLAHVLQQPQVAPRTNLEKLIADIIAEVLKLDAVSVFDNFFALGGDSLQGTQVVSRLNDQLGLDLINVILFQQPTVAALAAELEPLIHATLSQQEMTAPLSFAEQRLWFLNQLAGAHPGDRTTRAIALTGQLNFPALEQSLKIIVQRHETLRTRFVLMGDQPAKVIMPDREFPIVRVDLSEVPPDVRSQQPNNEIQAFLQQPFDLQTTPLIRVLLLRLTDQSHLLVFCLHHIISDGWSLGVLWQEYSALYQALCEGRSPALPELPIQYVDYARWQQEWLQGEVLETQLAYWQTQLKLPLPTLQLPQDVIANQPQNHSGGQEQLALSPVLTARLKQLNQQTGTTCFMVLLAAFQLLLSRYSGQTDMIVGLPIAGRQQVETEGLIGLFLNTLAIRTDLSGHPTFRQLLEQLRHNTLDAYEYQDLPFSKLIEVLNPQRDLHRHPVFDVMFNFVNTPQTNSGNLPQLQFESLDSLSEPAPQFLLSLYAREDAGQIKIRLVYPQATFSRDRILSLLDQYQYLLEQIVTAPDVTITSYSLVTPGSRAVLPDPSMVVPKPHYPDITQLVQAWVRRNPEQIAIVQGDRDRTWSYQALWQRSCTIAQTLLGQGIQPGDVVAVVGPRSFEFVANMLGVWLSGGVLLSIDPDLPQQRQQLMIEQAQARYFLPIATPVPVEQDRPFPAITAEAAAYVFFTSGTTGIPKAVLGNHQGLTHFLTWQQQTFAIQPHDRVAQLTNLSFDVVLRDIFLPLTSGATLCLPTPEIASQIADGGVILPWLAQQQISIIHAVPSLVRSWLSETLPTVALATLRWLFLAGEPLSDQLVQRWRQAFPTGDIVNLYGPTETTLAKSYYQVPQSLLQGTQPIGQALPNTQLLILADQQRLCGVGELGEIMVRSPFRTNGYLNASIEQQQRFMPNPYRPNDATDLCYATGDLGRYRPDGTIEILGRLDHQVKIRGVRIEPTEIEAILAKHPAIHQAIVVACADPSGDTCLVAYIVLTATADNASELRSFLKEHLPTVMLPAVWVELVAMPLLPNGKVDRRNLPPPDFSHVAHIDNFVAPRNELEQQLAQIWCEVLQRPQISIHDNFFDLGGHSLATTRVASRIRTQLQIELSIQTLFERPTIAELAPVIQDRQNGNASQNSQIKVQPRISPSIRHDSSR